MSSKTQGSVFFHMCVNSPWSKNLCVIAHTATQDLREGDRVTFGTDIRTVDGIRYNRTTRRPENKLRRPNGRLSHYKWVNEDEIAPLNSGSGYPRATPKTAFTPWTKEAPMSRQTAQTSSLPASRGRRSLTPEPSITRRAAQLRQGSSRSASVISTPGPVIGTNAVAGVPVPKAPRSSELGIAPPRKNALEQAEQHARQVTPITVGAKSWNLAS